MAIQRWEMLLSAQTDCYLLKIQGDRVDVDKILQAHPKSCQTVQEISGDVFQWVIFVVDAPISERLSIQNQVMSLTKDTTGITASNELVGILEGLSEALQDLTNLTEDEHTFVMNKMARLGSAPPAAPVPANRPPLPVKTVGETPMQIPSPFASPPAGMPLPRVAIPGRPGTPPPPRPPSIPLGAGPAAPAQPVPGNPLPPSGMIPNIVRPVQPPRSFPGAPPMPGAPLPSVPMPKISPPSIPLPKPALPPAGRTVEAPLVIPQLIPIPEKPASGKDAPPPTPATPIPTTTPTVELSVPLPTPAPTGLSELNSQLNTLSESSLPPRVEPLAYSPPPEISPAPAREEPVLPPAKMDLGSPPPSVPLPVKQDEAAALRISIFYPVGQEPVMDQFLKTLIDVAQKKSRRPTSFQVALSVPTAISLENSTEWIWKSKTSGSDIFFVILPEGAGIEILDPLVGEAQAAGLRCFLVPSAEVASKLLYMDLMVELMMFKRRIRTIG